MKHIDAIAALLTEDPDILNEITYPVGPADQRDPNKLGAVERSVLIPGQSKVQITDPRAEPRAEPKSQDPAIVAQLQQILSVDPHNPGEVLLQLVQKDDKVAKEFALFMQRLDLQNLYKIVSGITSVKQGRNKVLQAFDQWRKHSKSRQ